MDAIKAAASSIEDGSFIKPSRTVSVGQMEQGSTAVGAPLLAPNGGAPVAPHSAEIEARIDALSMQMASFAKQASLRNLFRSFYWGWGV